jgi:hypothetical protein
MKSRLLVKGRDSNYCIEQELGSAPLTVAILILFIGLILTALFLLVLTGLAALLALSRLSGLAALLTLPGLAGLTALLALSDTLFLHIVCHRYTLLEKARTGYAFEI